MGRIVLVFAAAAVVAGAIWATILDRPAPLVTLVTPMAIAGGLLLGVHHGYLALRALRWRARQRRERRELDRLAIPPEVPAQTEFPGVSEINRIQHEVLRHPPDFQGRMYSRGVKIAVLPALAVLLAALPNVRPNDRWWTIGAALAEVLTLGLVLWFVRRARNPTAPWVRSRTRAELLRREQYLRLAHVGPYLNRDDAEADAVAAQRVAEILGRAEPTELLPLRDATTRQRWLDELWRARPYGRLPRLRDRARSYLHYRIDKQIMWFTLGAASTRSAVNRIVASIRLAVVAGILVGLAQLGTYLAVADAATTNSPNALLTSANVLLLVLPPVTAFLMAVQELYSYRGLAASYEQTLKDLRSEREALVALIARIDDDPDSDDLARELQTFVLHVEGALTGELQSWILIIEREEFPIEG